MSNTHLQNRRIITAENDTIRVTSTVEGAHIAEILHKPSGVNPLWTPPWPSIEPSTHDFAKHPGYGTDAEAILLAGILGHNICLDTFGGPSPEEATAGMPVHGEGPVTRYETTSGKNEMTLAATLSVARLRFERRIRLAGHSPVVKISEELENLTASDRPIAWTQHVTLGPPFVAPGRTQFRIPATRSKVGDASFNDNLGPYVPDAEFQWPNCPLKAGGVEDFRVYTKAPVSAGFSTHLLDPSRAQAFFLAWSPESKVLFGYVWQRENFPWLARWEENHLRQSPPWNGRTLTCGMEFGVSPMAESRRKMIDRGSLFGVPGYRWAPAKATLAVEYCAFITTAESIPESVQWDGDFKVEFS